MRTVKDISELTGISVRTLHWYDEIGLLKPSSKSEAGYRLYDDKALEILQQILFFREFDMPLKTIKTILENPDFDRLELLKSQKQMLILKRNRLNRLIAGIEGVLKGEEEMNFEIFGETEIQELYQAIIRNMPGEQLQLLTKEYGGRENYEKHFMETAGSPEAQASFAKMVEWYGDKSKVIDAATNPQNPEIIPAYQKRMDEIMRKLAAKQGTDIHSFEVKALVGEYDFVARQLYQMEDVTAMMRQAAAEYRTKPRIQATLDGMYGDGAAAYIGAALEAFYR